jgi:hypothetical protein
MAKADAVKIRAQLGYPIVKGAANEGWPLTYTP